MHNHYFALRHAISEANEKGIIVSSPKEGIATYGLSERGRIQCGKELHPSSLLPLKFERDTTITLSSPFKRALETALSFTSLNDLAAPEIEDRLRERFFGVFEGESADYYERVWRSDRSDSSKRLDRSDQSETPDLVAQRLLELLGELEPRYKEMNIVLVSHGDPLQILEARLRGWESCFHRKIEAIGNAELRRLPSL